MNADTPTPAPASPAATEMALLPCPWCSNTSLTLEPFGTLHRPSFAVICEAIACGAMGPETTTRDEAIAAWNRRATPNLTALRAERDRLLRFLSRAFAVLDVMAGEGMFFAGTEDPADILMEYAATVDPEADYRDILKALAARAALAEGRADG